VAGADILIATGYRCGWFSPARITKVGMDFELQVPKCRQKTGGDRTDGEKCWVSDRITQTLPRKLEYDIPVCQPAKHVTMIEGPFPLLSSIGELVDGIRFCHAEPRRVR